jgi:catechol 2,3-dioxygenase-like lactoylglutathione lyase family enzyme/ketosteroid isomerase-like protein
MDAAAPEHVARLFNERINARDLDGLVALMAPEHVLIDSAGGRVEGRERAREAWRSFFAAFPDYQNHFDTVTARGDRVLITGRSICSHAELAGRALWSAIVRGDRVLEWRAYEDTAEQRAALVLVTGAVRLTGFDHIVLCTTDVERTLEFYRSVLSMEPRQERLGKWSLHFGPHKISVQDARAVPEIARGTVPGSASFCVLTDTPIREVIAHLERERVLLVEGPVERAGATGRLLSVYFNDPDGNLVEVSNPLA